MGNETVIDGWLVGAVLAALFFFGLAYNWLMSMLGDHKQGYVSFAVAIGSGMTIFGAYYSVHFSACPVWLLFSCFLASGLPMIGGDIVRSKKLERENLQRIQAKAARAAEELEK